MSIGGLIGFLVMVAAFVLAITHQMDTVPALMFGGLGLAILLSGIALPWRVAP